MEVSYSSNAGDDIAFGSLFLIKCALEEKSHCKAIIFVVDYI